MKRPKGEDGFNSTCRISILPEHILQKILYFLSQKEAVRTSVLSKSWRSIWCTRPDLDFSIHDFRGNKQDFITTVDNTLQRYLDQRLCIEEFSLRVSIGGDDDEESMPALEQWIQLVTNMGLKELRLRNSMEDSKNNHLPSVVFETESLKDLYLDTFIVDQNTIRRILLLKNLKSLDLQRVSIKDDIFEKIILSCPLIETLAVRDCRTLTTIDATSLQNLKKFTFLNPIYRKSGSTGKPENGSENRVLAQNDMLVPDLRRWWSWVTESRRRRLEVNGSWRILADLGRVVKI